MARAITAVAVLAALLQGTVARAAPMGDVVYVDSTKQPPPEAKADDKQSPTKLDTIVVTPLDPLYDTQLYRRLRKDLPALGTDGKPLKKKQSRVVKVLAWMFVPTEPPAEIDTSDQVLNQIRAHEMGIDK